MAWRKASRIAKCDRMPCFRPGKAMIALRSLTLSTSIAVLALSMSACITIVDKRTKPATLANIKLSSTPVLKTSVDLSARMERPTRSRSLRPFTNLPKPLLATVVTPAKRLQCVPYARRLSNIQIRGNAWTWWNQADGRYARSKTPKAGSVLVLKRKEDADSLGHVAYVEEVIDSRTIIVSHANWLNEGRLHNYAPVRDISENNDWSGVRFWHTPGGHFGGHIYKPYGFIRPNKIVASAE